MDSVTNLICEWFESSCLLFLFLSVKKLQDTSLDQASEVFKSNEDHELLTSLKAAGMSGERERVNELSVKFEEHSEQLQEVNQLKMMGGWGW